MSVRHRQPSVTTYGRPVPARPDTSAPDRQIAADCWAGRQPAEQLPPKWRELLIAELHAAGWTDVEMAVHTRLTSYTVARIRSRLGLRANREGA